MIAIAINLLHFNSLYNKGLGYYLSFLTFLDSRGFIDLHLSVFKCFSLEILRLYPLLHSLFYHFNECNELHSYLKL